MRINIHEFLAKFREEYNFLYDAKGEVAGMSEAVAAFDEACKDSRFADFVGEFVRFRGDFISSDREAAAFMFALTSFEEGSDMSNVIYLDDHRAGLHMFTPEMGERAPECPIEARMSYYGTHYFLTSAVELKGRGIVPMSSANGKTTYRATKKAFEKVKAEYPVSMCCYLD